MFLSDQETEVDLLYYEAIARTVVKLIGETKSSAVTIGVHGDWGAGKSSVLKMTSAAFEGRIASYASGSMAGRSRVSTTRKPFHRNYCRRAQPCTARFG